MGADEPRQAEPLAVAQARMEGKIDVVIGSIANVAEKVVDLGAEVFAHREKISHLDSVTQQLEFDVKAAAKAVVDAEIVRKNTALAVEEADGRKVAAAKALVEQGTTKWSQRQTFAVIGGFVLAIVVGVFGIVWAIKTGSPAPLAPLK